MSPFSMRGLALVGLVLLQGCGNDAEGLAREGAAGGLPQSPTHPSASEADGSMGVPDAEALLQPTRVIRGDPDQAEWWDLRLFDERLAEFEGKVVRARIGDPDRPPERLGSGEAVILNGAFSMVFVQVWEAPLYKRKLLFVDVNDNGSCDPGVDRVFQDYRGVPDLELSLQNGERSELDMPVSSDTEADCLVLSSTWPEE
jgi:hypothetical protein